MTVCPAVGIVTASGTRVAAHVSPLGSDTTAPIAQDSPPADFFLRAGLLASLGGVSAGFAASGFSGSAGFAGGSALADHPFGLVVPAGAGVIALANAAAEHLARQRRFQFAADQALEFTRTELRLVAFFREMVDQRLIEGERHARWRRCGPHDRAAGRRYGGSPPCPAHGRR